MHELWPFNVEFELVLQPRYHFFSLGKYKALDEAVFLEKKYFS